MESLCFCHITNSRYLCCRYKSKVCVLSGGATGSNGASGGADGSFGMSANAGMGGNAAGSGK